MTTPTQSLPLRRGSNFTRRNRRPRRFALQCEALETRQLLSIGQTGLAAGMLANPSAFNGQLFVPALVSNMNTPNAQTIEIEFGSIGGLNQIQIVIFGSAPIFAPTPTVPSFGGGGSSSLGALTGNLGNTWSGNTPGSTGLGSATTPNSAITPLNPNLTSIMTSNTPGSPVSLVPLSIAPLVVHLGSSASPATAIANSTLISALEEQPPALTHFGQADTFVGRRLFLPNIETDKWNASLIDHVEPFDRLAPVDNPAPQAAPAPGNALPKAPDAPPAPALPPMSDPNVDAALDLTDSRLLTRSYDGSDSQADEQLSNTNTSWSFSAIFGAAAVAAGGYHLVLRETDRVRGRAIPRWLGAERPNKRKSQTPPA